MSETLGGLIHRLRTEKGLTLDALAQQIGTSKAFLSLVEKDRSGISNENAGKLAKLLGADAGVLIDLQDAKRGEVTEPWIRYLVAKYQPSEYVLNVCKKFVSDSGFSASVVNEEDGHGFEDRWDSFYALIKQFLDNPNYKVFINENVQRALHLLGMAGCDRWVSLQQKVFDLILKRLGDGADCETTSDWRRHVESALGIETVRLNSSKMAPLMMGALTSGAAQNVLAGMTMVAASPSIYGAIYKYNDVGAGKQRYCFVEDHTGEKANLQSETFWYEAARVLIDEELSLGHGCEYVPDGAPFDPFHFFLTRIGSWMALSFKKARQLIGNLSAERQITPAMILQLKKSIAPDVPIRFVMEGMVDQIQRPLFYLDCYLRLKKDQLEKKNIRMADVESMRRDPEALLRVGRSFRNVIATDSSTDIRFNLQISDSSIIRKAYDQKNAVGGRERLESWDPRYHLKGEVQIAAEYSKTGHDNVRVLMELLI